MSRFRAFCFFNRQPLRLTPEILPKIIATRQESRSIFIELFLRSKPEIRQEFLTAHLANWQEIVYTPDMPLGIDVKDLVTVQQAADQLGISKQAIHQALRDGRLEAIRLGGNLFLLAKDVAAYKPTGPHLKNRKDQNHK
jgi:excisionase family DNA binding protein